MPQGDYILITGTDFNDGYIDWKNCCYVSKWRYDQDTNIQIKEGDVLISKDGTIGKVAFLNCIPGPGTLNNGVFVVRPKQEDIVNQAYLSWIFKSIWFKSFIDQLTAGSTINHLYQKDFVKFKLVYPNDKSEQTRIATALSNIDALISELRKLIEKKRAIKQGAMQQLLTGKKRLKEFSEPWVEKKLGEIANTITTGKLDANAMVEGGKYRFYTCASTYFWIDKYAFNEEALLISGNGENVGYVHYYKGKFNAYQRTYVLYGFSEDILFVKHYLQLFLKTRIDKEKSASNTPYILMSTVTDMILKLPQQKEEQSAIAFVLTSMDDEIVALESKKAKYEQIKQGMMQQLLTGKIKLLNSVTKTNTTTANVHFRRSVLAAEIADRERK